MAKRQIFFTLIILVLIVLPVTLINGASVVYAEENTKPQPFELDATEWEVEMVYVTDKGKKEISSDTLMFKDKKFISKEFENNKYTPTNYSVSVAEDGSTNFGTMQIKDKETAFWKGTIKDGKIDGSVHTQLPNGTTKATYFNGTLTSGVLKLKVKDKPKPPAPVVNQQVPEQPVVTPIQAQLEVTIQPNTSESTEAVSIEEEISSPPAIDQEAVEMDNTSVK